MICIIIYNLCIQVVRLSADPLGLSDFLIGSDAITTNTTLNPLCDLSLARLNSAPVNQAQIPGYCPTENGYIQVELESAQIITAIAIQV